MKNKISSLLAIAALTVATLMLGTGCAGNTQQLINSASGDGMHAKVAVPLGSIGSIGAELFVGRFNDTAVIQPTSTNDLHAPSLAVAVAGWGKQSVSGAAGTNNAVGISDGSRDASILTTGAGGVTAQNGTNVLLNVHGE